MEKLLLDFSKALFCLLQEKSLESISVGELCRKADYPRSTFYNHFHDINALMDRCWESIREQMIINDFQSIDNAERTAVLFDRIYDYMNGEREMIDRLLKFNSVDGAMFSSLNACIRRTIYRLIEECPFSYRYPMPENLVAKHYSNTVQMILSACFLDKTTTKKEADAYIGFLLGTLEKAI